MAMMRESVTRERRPIFTHKVISSSYAARVLAFFAVDFLTIFFDAARAVFTSVLRD
jgi:hypothetical protein